jgi:hypothetical protein
MQILLNEVNWSTLSEADADFMVATHRKDLAPS